MQATFHTWPGRRARVPKRVTAGSNGIVVALRWQTAGTRQRHTAYPKTPSEAVEGEAGAEALRAIDGPCYREHSRTGHKGEHDSDRAAEGPTLVDPAYSRSKICAATRHADRECD